MLWNGWIQWSHVGDYSKKLCFWLFSFKIKYYKYFTMDWRSDQGEQFCRSLFSPKWLKSAIPWHRGGSFSPVYITVVDYTHQRWVKVFYFTWLYFNCLVLKSCSPRYIIVSVFYGRWGWRLCILHAIFKISKCSLSLILCLDWVFISIHELATPPVGWIFFPHSGVVEVIQDLSIC